MKNIESTNPVSFVVQEEITYLNYIFMHKVKGVQQVLNFIRSQICSEKSRPATFLTFHTGPEGSALCTAACVSTLTLAACSGWVSSPHTHQ